MGRLRSVLTRGLLLAGEVVVIPGVLLYVFVTIGHPMLGLVAVFGWRAAWIVSRAGSGSRVPATCWLAFGLFLARTVAGLAVSSVGVYLLIPVLLCAIQGLVFLGSPLARQPLMMRLATDYVEELPQHHPALRRLFTQLSCIWGGVHLVCAGLGAWALTLPAGQAVAANSGLSIACTATSVAGCLGWGLWRSARIPGLRIACGEKRPATELPAAVGHSDEALAAA
jgi:hypothetical protein